MEGTELSGVPGVWVIISTGLAGTYFHLLVALFRAVVVFAAVFPRKTEHWTRRKLITS